MPEQVEFDDSNIALLNSKLHKDVRLSAAKTEEAWEGAGKAPGVQIWRIEQFKVKDWDKSMYGKFCSGDSYIVLYTYKAKDEEGKETDKFKYNVHFWLGTDTTQDEAGTAAYKTVELDDLLGDVPVQYREVQGVESATFRKIFPKLQYSAGGVDSGFNVVKPTEYRNRLLHVKGKHSLRIVEVPLKSASLCDGDVYILDAGLTLFQWNGSQSSVFERRRGNELVKELKAERSSKPTATILDGLEDHKVFWELLGGKPDAVQPATDDSEVEECKKLYKLSDASGSLKCTKVAEGAKVNGSLMSSSDCYILDEGFRCFVWVGSKASSEERRNSMCAAVSYMNACGRSVATPLIRVVEGSDCEGLTRALGGVPGTAGSSGAKVFPAASASGASTSASTVEEGENAVEGVIELKVEEAKELHLTQNIFKQDPFARVKYGKTTFRTSTHEDGEMAAKWQEGEPLIFRFPLNRAADVELEVINENVLVNSRIGSCSIAVKQLTASASGAEWLPLTRKGGEEAGQIRVSWNYIGPVSLTVTHCKDLRKVQMIGKQDPFVKIKVANQWRFQTRTCSDGGATPSWSENNSLVFNPSMVDANKAQKAKGGSAEQKDGEYFVEFKVKNDNIVKDSDIAYGRISLKEVLAAQGKAALECPLQKGVQDEGKAGTLFFTVA